MADILTPSWFSFLLCDHYASPLSLVIRLNETYRRTKRAWHPGSYTNHLEKICYKEVKTKKKKRTVIYPGWNIGQVCWQLAALKCLNTSQHLSASLSRNLSSPPQEDEYFLKNWQCKLHKCPNFLAWIVEFSHLWFPPFCPPSLTESWGILFV